MKPLLALLALVAGCANAEDVYSYAPVYTPSGASGILIRIGSFRYKATAGFDVIYCTIQSTAHRRVMCVVHAPQDRLVLMELDATEHKT